LLPLLAAAEAALDEATLLARVRARRRARRLATVNIVDFAAEHAEAFAELNLHWVREHFEVEPADREILGDPQGAVLDRGGAILIALEGDDPVGTCALLPTEHGLELAKMAVAPRAQGLGIGRRILEAALERARHMGASRLFLLTHTKLTAAVALYAKMGFEPMGEIPDSPFSRVDLAMERPL
jgi:GNAT superfamily N-acetyltransferase